MTSIPVPARLCRPCLAALLALQLLLAAPAAGDERPRLALDGGTTEQRDNIEATLDLARQRCELPEFRESRVLRDAESRARDALRAIGYYHPELELSLDRDSGPCWTLNLDFDPGPPTTVEWLDLQVTGEGRMDPAFEAILMQTQIATGDVLRHDRYEALRSRSTRVAAERGYFDAELTLRRLEVDTEQRTASIRLHMDTGPRYQLGEIRIEQDILRGRFMQRLLPFEPGEPYASARIIELQRNLNNSGYFESVRVRPLRDEAEERRVPVMVELEPRNRLAFEAGIGYSTDIGPRTRFGMENRYANRRGHRYTGEVEASPVRSGVAFNYEIPLRDPLRERLNLFTSWRTEDTSTQQFDRFQLGTSRVLQRESGWQTTEMVRYEYEDYTVSDQTDTSRLLIPSYRVSRTEADDPMTPRRGYRLEGTVQGAAEELLSTTSFAQVRGNARYIRGLGPGRALLRADVGFTEVDSVRELPSSLRFYAGGDGSIRGYGYQKLGPKNEDGDIIGGRHRLVGSAEYEIPVVGDWSAAIFVDAGNAFDDFSDFDTVYGAGVGVRWRSPVGPIRLDIAHGPDSDDDFRIHFSMGPDL
ncbi:autotransporter assembly complex family protein [Thioalkalivibrio sp. ALgr3]|uniref:autotransporter assembly complex protein TamA n=1 Tax=Thioalkalivibrio sp. ALgr3 TaxID=1239292 RepID=UPI0003A05144|nr:autotransporter assembly complex family protein [Thioalkalivibrio sp. ALgr3]